MRGGDSKMKKLSFVMTAGLIALAIGACVGDAPEIETPEGPDIVEPPVITGPSIAGIVMDYVDANGILADFQVSTDGLQVPVTATSATDGAFTLANIVEGSTIIPAVIPAADALYRPTANPPVLVGNTDITSNVYAISEPYLTQQLAGLGLDVFVPETSVVYIELLDDLGIPMEGVAAVDVQLLDAQGLPVGKGPFFVGANSVLHPTEVVGDIVLPILTSELHDGKARVAFVDVPVGAHTLTVPNPANLELPYTLPVVSVSNAASILRTGRLPGGIADLPLPPAGTLSFTADIYPRLQTVAQRGFGCTTAGCHNQLNPAASPILRFDKEANVVYTDMTGLLGAIDILNPAESMLYTKPMREVVGLQNHPNFTCPGPGHPLCDGILLWISEGAVLTRP